MREAGIRLDVGRNSIRVKPSKKLSSVDITTMPHAGFPTDVQAQMMVLMLKTPGISIITERIFESRFMHVNELSRMGADISIEGPSAIVKGGQPLSGADVMASDLRASAALVLAGLAAKGTTRVNRVYHIDRGYEDIDGKLRTLGARITREPGSNMSTESKQVTLALIQAKADSDPATNLQATLAKVEQSAADGANIVCTQELFATEYFCQSEDHDNFHLAESIPGATTEAFQRLAKRCGIVIVVLAFSKNAAPACITIPQQCIDADGSLLLAFIEKCTSRTIRQSVSREILFHTGRPGLPRVQSRRHAPASAKSAC